ncbi:MAG TPA: GAF domain-containing protein [Candidatus Acidoferrales bacterium]|nr:GAF domain-containing protein [Candidatus Acidoferrales bacterium]
MKLQQRKTKPAPEVLLVEDSPTQRAQLEHFLRDRGYKVRTAANGIEALAAIRRRKPSIVISDIVMPEMDGYTLCKEIKSRRGLREIPFVLLTALSEPKDVIHALQCGADSFIRKPPDETYFLSRVNYILTNRAIRKSAKVRMGLEVHLAGQRHFISAERQQIFDMLIATYDETVRINEELAQREKELRRSYHSLNGLYRIAEGLNQATSEQELVEEALERAGELPGVRAGWIILKSDDFGFRMAAARNLPPALAAPGALEGDCLCRRTLLSGELKHAANIFECERLKNAASGTEGLRYHASVPLEGARETVGLLNLAASEQGLFSDEELRMLGAVGQQIGLAVERARLFGELERRVEKRTAALRAEVARRKRAQQETRRNLERIRALHEIDLAITSTLDLKSVLHVLLQKVDHFLAHASVSGIRLLDPETGEIKAVACTNADLEEWQSAIRQSRSDFAKEIMETKAPLAIADVQQDPRTRGIDFFRKHGLVSLLAAPLVAKQEFLGTLSYYTKEAHQFTGQEIEFLSTLAGQAAIAIQNAQLYADMKKQSAALAAANEALRRREQIQALLKEINQDSMALDIDKLLQKLTDRVREFMRVDISDVRIIEAGGTRPLAASGAKLEELAERQGAESDRTCYLSNRAPLAIPDITAQPPVANRSVAPLNIKGYLEAPLFFRNGDLAGVLRALTYRPRDFTAEEIDLIEQLAHGAATALENSRLYRDLEATNAKLQEQEAIQRLLKELSQDITALELQNLLHKLTAQVRQVLGVDVCEVRTFGGDIWRELAISGLAEERNAPRGRGRRMGLSSWIRKNRRPLAIFDAHKQTEYVLSRRMQNGNLRGFLGVPLITREGEVIGVLRCMTYEPRAFSAAECELLQQLANGAAIAIENARLYKDLEKSNKVKTEFLGIMSHELRTPLNIIMGYTTMLFEEMLGEIKPEQREALNKVIRQSKQLLAMVESIMEATKIESGSVVVEKQEVGLTNFLEDLRSAYDMPLEKDVKVLWDYPSDLPAVAIDRVKLTHVLQNLIDNAIKFTEQGTVTVCARVLERGLGVSSSASPVGGEEKQEAPVVEFSVADTGVGIAAKDLPVIFDMFRQIDSSDTRLYGGVGLGLYIVKKFTEVLGGTVGVQSEPGKGSVFSVRIPCRPLS